MKRMNAILLCLMMVLSACTAPIQTLSDTPADATPIQASVQPASAADMQPAPTPGPGQPSDAAELPLAVREIPWRGGVLRAELHGTEEPYRGLLATELRVTGPDGFEQIIPLEDEEPAQLHDDEYLFAMEDMNLDGEPDIRVAKGIFAGGNTPFDVFVWDAFSGTFIKDGPLSDLLSPSFMPNVRLIIQSAADGAASRIDSVYANVDGELREFFRREYLYDGKNGKEYIVQSMLENGAWMELPREPVPTRPSMPHDADALARAIAPPPGEIAATRYGAVGGKPVRVDACIPQGDDSAKTIVISGEGGIWQTIEQDWTAPIDSENENFLTLKDYNFDGEPDIRLSSNIPARDDYHIFWLWDAAAGQFVTSNALDRLPGVQLCSEGLLLSYSSGGAAVHSASLYAWVGGEPLCIYRLVVEGFRYGEDTGEAYVISLYNGIALEPWALGTNIPAAPVSGYGPEEIIVLDFTAALPVAGIAAAERYNGPLNPTIYPQVPGSDPFTHVIDVYFDPVAIRRGNGADALVHADSTGVYEHASIAFETLYETTPGTRIVGLAEGSKYRVYWLETDGSAWALKTLSTLGDESAQTVMTGTAPADVAEMRLAKGNLICFAVPADDYDNDFALLLYNIWDTDDDDFGIGKPGEAYILEGESPLETQYSFAEGRYARVIKTDRGGAVEIVPMPLPQGEERNGKRHLLLTGAMPQMAVAAHDGVFFQIGSKLYKYLYDAGKTLLISDDAAWFTLTAYGDLLFAADGASTIYQYRDANPEANWDACMIPLLHIDGAEFSSATIVHHETTDLVAVGVQSGEPLAAAVQLTYLVGE